MQKCWCVWYYRIDIEQHKNNSSTNEQNINAVLRLYPLPQSLVIGSYIEMLMRRVLADRYRRTQEQFQYHGVEISMTFQAYTLYQISKCEQDLCQSYTFRSKDLKPGN